MRMDYGWWAGRTVDDRTHELDLVDLMDLDFSFLFGGENFFVLSHDQNHVLMMQLFQDKIFFEILKIFEKFFDTDLRREKTWFSILSVPRHMMPKYIRLRIYLI